MDRQTIIQQLGQLLQTAQNLVVILPENLTQDKVASALALYLSLKKTNKKVQIVSSQPITVAYSRLVGADRVQSQLGGNELVISFDYVKDEIEKVSYNFDNNKFNLVIQAVSGHEPLSTDKVSYQVG